MFCKSTRRLLIRLKAPSQIGFCFSGTHCVIHRLNDAAKAGLYSSFNVTSLSITHHGAISSGGRAGWLVAARLLV